MDQTQTGWIAGFIWGIADDVLGALYVRGKYRPVIKKIHKKGTGALAGVVGEGSP